MPCLGGSFDGRVKRGDERILCFEIRILLGSVIRNLVSCQNPSDGCDLTKNETEMGNDRSFCVQVTIQV